MRGLKGFQIIALVSLGFFVGYFLGVNRIRLLWKDYRPVVIESKVPPASTPLDLSLFYQVLDKINADYYDKTKIDAQKIIYGAISGALSSLGDPYTAFFPPKENKEFKTSLSGQFEGIGAELGLSDDKRIIVISPLDDSPAQKSGIRAEDKIMKVDGKDTTGWSLSEAVSKIRGPKGTVVVLTVLHKGEKNPVEIKVTRDVITVKSVTGWVSPVDCSGGRCVKKNAKDLPSVAYIRLSQFGDRTNGEWINVVNKLYLDIKKTKRFAGIVLDLRNNPGGYLNDAAFIASEFIDSGVVVWQEDGSGERRSISVIRKGVFTSDPLVVLVNRGSASASEIVAGALRDHNRARLVGENTFGKGTIQEPIELGGGASVHVSVAKWLTPNGTWVNGKGLTPDIRVPFDEKQTSGETLDNQLSAAIEFLLNNKESLVINK